MKINNIVTEELNNFLKEIETGHVQTYPYTEIDEGRFEIKVDDEIKNIHVIYLVLFSKTGKEDEHAYEIAFKVKGGDYNDITGFGIQFRILATITKIIKDLMPKYNPNILRFQPLKAQGEHGNRRLSLYMQYVKGGAGQDFDSFIIEKRNPSFPLENGYQEPETIQDIITQCSLYGGYYETDEVPHQSADYAKFSVTNWNDFRIDTYGKADGTLKRNNIYWVMPIRKKMINNYGK